MNIYCNSLFYLIALDFATRSFELINDKEFRKVMKFAEGFIIWLIFFLSCNVLSRPAPRFRFERIRERSFLRLQDLALPSATVCAHICTYMCVSGDRMLSSRSSKQLERLHSERQYRTSRVQNTLDKKHLYTVIRRLKNRSECHERYLRYTIEME